MRFLFIEEAQNLGGARIATINTATLLKQEGNEVIIVDIWGTCQPFLERCKQKGLQLSIVKKRYSPIVIGDGGFINRVGKLFLFFLNVFDVNHRLKKVIKEYNPDFICLSSKRVYLYLLGESFNRIVYFQHEWGLKRQFSKLNAFFLRKTRCIICVSEATRQSIYNNGFKEMSSLYVYHTGVSKPVLTKTIEKENRFTIIHSAGFIKPKGQLISIEIARVLKEESLNFKMILMGVIYNNEESKSYYNELRHLVKQYGLNDNIQFVVSPENVFDYVDASDILIHPSQAEGYGMVVAEAQLMGKPVIANPVGGVIDLIANGFTGFLANYNDVNDYVRIIKQLYENKLLYETIKNNAYNFVTTSITLDNQKSQLIRIFKYLYDGNNKTSN